MYSQAKASRSSRDHDNNNSGPQAEVLNPVESRRDELRRIFGDEFQADDRDERMLTAFAQIAAFLDDTPRVQEGLRALSTQLEVSCATPEQKTDPWRLRKFLRQFEQGLGFNFGDRSALLEVGLIYLDEDGEIMLGDFLERDRFMRLIAEKITWDDSSVAGHHGALTHRIQWWLIHWALGEQLAAQGLQVVDVYQRISKHLWPDPSPLTVLDLCQQGVRFEFLKEAFDKMGTKNLSLWDYLLDLPEGALGARSPDFIGQDWFHEAKLPEIDFLRKSVSDHATVASVRLSDLRPPTHSGSSADDRSETSDED